MITYSGTTQYALIPVLYSLDIVFLEIVILRAKTERFKSTPAVGLYMVYKSIEHSTLCQYIF